MKFFEIKYCLFSWEDIGVIVVSADSPAEAIKKAGLQDAYEYSVKEYIPYKLGNRRYNRKLNTYNAMWLGTDGKPAIWGSYNSTDGSYYLRSRYGTMASGIWVQDWDDNWEFESMGSYSYDEVRRALQLGVITNRTYTD